MASPEFLAAVEALREGHIVVAATDTLIGLLVDAHNDAAVAALADLKPRRPGQAMALIAPNVEAALEILELSPGAASLAETHWPGALTLVAPARVPLHPALTLHGNVGVRVPAACDARALAEALGRAVTATSANPSGAPAPSSTDALDPVLRAAVLQTGGQILEGSAPGGPPSTIVDASDGIRVLRHGSIALALDS